MRYEFDDRGFRIRINRNVYSVKYPAGIFSQFNNQAKGVLLDNFVYGRTLPLTLCFDCPLDYYSSSPFFKKLIEEGLIGDLPRTSQITKMPFKKLQARYLKNKSRILFKRDNDQKILNSTRLTADNQAIISMSFGKDSLLSYALANEIGLKTHLVYIDDISRYCRTESQLKLKISRLFSREQQRMTYLYDDTNNVFRQPGIEDKYSELDGANEMLLFALELVPVAYHYRAGYIIFGNEHNFNDYFLNRDRTRLYPSFDQTADYTRKENRLMKHLTNNNVSVLSLVEPIYNLAEFKILFSRYSYLLKYLMSCSSDQIKDSKWCYDCPMCAKAFLYAMAVGGQPKAMGMKHNLFESKYRKLYPLFASQISRVYEKPKAVRDEQLLAFLLASRRGAGGALIDRFVSRYLPEAENREAELKARFFGIHSAPDLPSNLRSKIASIYRSELKKIKDL